MEKSKALLKSWARSFLAAALAIVATGETNPDNILKGALIAFVPVLIRALDPKDKAFGVNS